MHFNCHHRHEKGNNFLYLLNTLTNKIHWCFGWYFPRCYWLWTVLGGGEQFSSALEYIDGHKLLVFPSVCCTVNNARGDSSLCLWNKPMICVCRCFHRCTAQWAVSREGEQFPSPLEYTDGHKPSVTTQWMMPNIPYLFIMQILKLKTARTTQ
jgi:hypothetical protein